MYQKMKKHYLITGTDTGVGKTKVTGLLALALSQSGHRVLTQKWVQTGSLVPEDVHQHDLILGKKPFVQAGEYRAPYCFLQPVSPHLAGNVDLDVLEKAFHQCVAQADTVLVEGAGGVLVPLTPDILTIDFAAELELPVLLVADNRVGAINHTLLSVKALHQRGLTIKGVIWNQCRPDVAEDVQLDNPKIVEAFLQKWGIFVSWTRLEYGDQDGKKLLNLLD